MCWSLHSSCHLPLQFVPFSFSFFVIIFIIIYLRKIQEIWKWKKFKELEDIESRHQPLPYGVRVILPLPPSSHRRPYSRVHVCPKYIRSWVRYKMDRNFFLFGFIIELKNWNICIRITLFNFVYTRICIFLKSKIDMVIW